MTVECVIPQQYHRTVMGNRGMNVQEITKVHEVGIKFPDRAPQQNGGAPNAGGQNGEGQNGAGKLLYHDKSELSLFLVCYNYFKMV